MFQSKFTLQDTFVSDASADTPEGAILRAGGRHVHKTITLSANNTSAAVNVFKVTGTVEIDAIHGEVMDATTLTNCTGVYLDLWDGTVSVEITKAAGGATLSNAPVGTFMIKDANVASNLTVALNNQARVTEASSNKVAFPFLVTQKSGVDTFIRFRYTTTDAPINAQISLHAHYKAIDGGTIEAV